MWQWIGRRLVAVACLALGLSFAGGLHPIGDSLAVFRPFLLGSLCLACLTVWRWRLAQWMLCVSIVLGAVHVGQSVLYEGPKQWANWGIYQKNLLYVPQDRSALVADILRSGSDVVTLQEVSGANLPVLEALRAHYPHQLLCGDFSVGKIAILSRWPMIEKGCPERTGFARAVVRRVDTFGSAYDVQVFSFHLHWPWPYGQSEQVDALVNEIERFPVGRTVVGGDFNMVPQGSSLKRIESILHVGRVGPQRPTFSLFGYPLAIDHVLASGGAGLISVRPRFNSDHHGLHAIVELF